MKCLALFTAHDMRMLAQYAPITLREVAMPYDKDVTTAGASKVISLFKEVIQIVFMGGGGT